VGGRVAGGGEVVSRERGRLAKGGGEDIEKRGGKGRREQRVVQSRILGGDLNSDRYAGASVSSETPCAPARLGLQRVHRSLRR